MDQHFVPRSYLRQWCREDGFLIRYRRVGPPGALRLVADKKPPEGVCWEPDLYLLPEGGVANGLTGNGVEHLLAKAVDESIAPIVEAIGERTGLVDPLVGGKVKWLMQNFTARAPSTLSVIEKEVVSFAVEHESWILRTLERAMTPAMRSELSQYLDPRMPAVAARASLAGMAANQFIPMSGWLEGRVCVLHSKNAKAMLAAFGLVEFPTFEEPVVQWQDNEAGLVASWSVSPDAIVFVIDGHGAHPYELARRHIISSLRHQRSAICRQKVPEGFWLDEAQNLVPWSPAE
ncbi:DUF4238 domain-containing protein [Corallococcus sp. AS-1-12]|uniref:DUF4238 domain-containing protein n=1 Tax=Corallococcus sp. AS-1-12 TaxID=2874598 RepID=UPI001CBB7678|nr:DUF4238 domain-containing protein [Corallococcus sp. AS-1-12]MBZ4336663.1 DUF4238 domain-containing protein [Corallococcus sp. AS-1-12]